jgi:predicted transcriptional regulator
MSLIDLVMPKQDAPRAVRIDDDRWEKLGKIAKKRGTNRHALIREILKNLIDNEITTAA